MRFWQWRNSKVQQHFIWPNHILFRFGGRIKQLDPNYIPTIPPSFINLKRRPILPSHRKFIASKLTWLLARWESWNDTEYHSIKKLIIFSKQGYYHKHTSSLPCNIRMHIHLQGCEHWIPKGRRWYCVIFERVLFLCLHISI